MESRNISSDDAWRKISTKAKDIPNPINLRAFKYAEENLQSRISDLTTRGYQLSQSYTTEDCLKAEEIEERIETTKQEIRLLSLILEQREAFNPIKLQLKNT